VWDEIREEWDWLRNLASAELISFIDTNYGLENLGIGLDFDQLINRYYIESLASSVHRSVQARLLLASN